MVWVSLFDGISCGRLALQRAGITPTMYLASEVEKSPIMQTMENWPDTIQLGDVRNIFYKNGTIYYGEFDSIYVGKIAGVIGGSPCQGLSMAGKRLNFDDPRSKLFFEFNRFLNEVRAENPDVEFLLENVVMDSHIQEAISELMGVEPKKINSKIATPQNRVRLYWSNMLFDSSWMKPKQLHEIIDFEKTDNHWRDSWNGKVSIVRKDLAIIPEATKKGYTEVPSGTLVDMSFISSKSRRGRKMLQHTHCITETDLQFYLFKDGGFRRLEIPELEALQTLPVGYTKSMSYNQAQIAIGNGWTVDVIAGFLRNSKSININQAS